MFKINLADYSFLIPYFITSKSICKLEIGKERDFTILNILYTIFHNISLKKSAVF